MPLVICINCVVNWVLLGDNFCCENVMEKVLIQPGVFQVSNNGAYSPEMADLANCAALHYGCNVDDICIFLRVKEIDLSSFFVYPESQNCLLFDSGPGVFLYKSCFLGVGDDFLFKTSFSFDAYLCFGSAFAGAMSFEQFSELTQKNSAFLIAGLNPVPLVSFSAYSFESALPPEVYHISSRFCLGGLIEFKDPPMEPGSQVVSGHCSCQLFYYEALNKNRI